MFDSFLFGQDSRIRSIALLCCLLASFTVTVASGQDSVEFLNGSKLEGKILEIRKPQKEFDIQTSIGGKSIKRTYPYSKVHAVNFGGKRFVLTKLPKDGSVDTGGQGITKRSSKEVRDLIETVGSSLPDWYESTPLNHPDTLQLDWPLKPTTKQWNESINVGQYIWGRVNPNVGRWKSGLKLVYLCMDKHEGNTTLLNRDHLKLGEMYFTLLQDYPRAAYHLSEGRVTAKQPNGIYLAECYWRLGNKAMALKMLLGGSVHFDAIKVLGDMGEVDRAIKIANQFGKTSAFNEAFLNAGDALRGAERFDEAIKFYQEVLNRDQARNEEYKKRFHARASGAIEAIKLFDQADVSKVPDGVYADTSTGYNGQLKVEVTVADAKISSVKVVDHREKQFYAALTDTPGQIIRKQSVQGIDGTSGATITSQAIIHASARALAQNSK